VFGEFMGMETSKHHQGEIHSGDIPDDELVGVSSVAGRVIPHKWRFSSLGKSTVNGGLFKQTTLPRLISFDYQRVNLGLVSQ